MLKKAEIAAWAKLPLPKYNKTDYVAAVARQGDMLQVDVVGKNGSFVRFACDGKNLIGMRQKNGEVMWSNAKPSGLFGHVWSTPNVTCAKEQVEECRQFLEDDAQVSDWRLNSADNVVYLLDMFVEHKRQTAYRKREEDKWALFREHQAMFPPMPKDLPNWCEEKGVYTGKYLFISKTSGGKRQAVCSCCGKRYTIKGGRHREWTVCRRCGQTVQMIGDWYDLRLEEKQYVTVCYNVDEQLLIRTVQLHRWFEQGKKVYKIGTNDDQCLVLYLRDTKGGGKIYCYTYQKRGMYTRDWRRCQINSPEAWRGWVYDRNLRDVFGESIYGIDMSALRGAKGPLQMVRLLDNLKQNPVAEYLYKMGMYRLASEWYYEYDTKHAKASFATVLEVNPQYKSMYTEMDVCFKEHRIIKNSLEYIKPEELRRFREMFGQDWSYFEVNNAFGQAPFGKCLRYIDKQVSKARAAREKVSAIRVVGWLYDYWEMCAELRVDMTDKTVRWPQNIKLAHDRLAERIAEDERQKKEEAERKEAARWSVAFAQTVKEVYPRIRVPKDDTYTVVMPQSRAGFLREGESLHHCVGRMGYYEAHCKGRYLICFVRRLAEPDKPFFTMELDVDTGRIKQLYGLRDCAAPKEVRQFAERVARMVRKKTKKPKMWREHAFCGQLQ